MYVKTKLSPPWVTLFNQIKALFEQDPEIKIEFINDPPTVKLYVENNEKAEALAALLPYQIDLGLTRLSINIIPSNTGLPFVGHLTFNKESQYTNNGIPVNVLFGTAFEGNPILNKIYVVEGIFSNRFIYVEFKPEIVQFYNDNLGDLNGNVTTLYETIARNVFNENSNLKGIFYCTAAIEK